MPDRTQRWPASTLAPMAWDYCPWQHLGDLDGVEVRYHDDGDAGFIDFETRTVSLRRGMTGPKRRATLAHEIAHLEMGPVREGGAERVGEVLAEGTAVLRLIPAGVLNDLGGLVQKYGVDAAAAFLQVDARLVRMALAVLNDV